MYSLRHELNLAQHANVDGWYIFLFVALKATVKSIAHEAGSQIIKVEIDRVLKKGELLFVILMSYSTPCLRNQDTGDE